MRSRIAAVALTISFAAAPAYASSDAEAEQIFLEYQRAIAAAESCYDVRFGMAEHQAMMDVINAAVENKIGTKRLRLITQAETEVRGALPSQSCRGEKVKAWLALFEEDLRPALQGVP